ncbi:MULTISPECIES: S9 family peptidase [unclassified Meiothermus]|uniref:alpha/beta hydrolase family protein n=1 Tax=unclassified Meiothermus TaxID=370471 RepID=UPI000D7CB070|nr:MULTISPECIES: alpha/beta fold hydrolase [unclassified Meiothermus]PZA07616.1 alpha/beta hydrolase [Meiothermus sp. Pnk-1]RYM29404.1 alpha/beta fold hydrolase [Meiothermus sp. PNK-Is4]
MSITRLLPVVAAVGLSTALAQANPLEHPMAIETLRRGSYPGSAIVLEQRLAPGPNYQRYIASYRSEGLKIYGLLTIPSGKKPQGGWPGIVFVHGYIPPEQYRTTERYVAYVDGFARQGYVVFKIDLRGHGNSEGEPSGAYWSPGYTIDVLNAYASLRRFGEVNPERIGMWGHSMGGYLTLRAMVIDRRIRAGVIWAGVVAPYSDILGGWRRPSRPGTIPSQARRRREEFIRQYGTPENNPAFWNAISANSYLSQGVSPIQLHHGLADNVVPVSFSQRLSAQLKAAGQTHELYLYPGNDHNLSQSFATAMRKSVAFFDRYLK